MKEKIKLMIDIFPPSGRKDFKFQPVVEAEPEIKTGEKNNNQADKNSVTDESLDRLMSDIMNGDVSVDARREIEAIMSRGEDPLVELATVGASFYDKNIPFQPRNPELREQIMLVGSGAMTEVRPAVPRYDLHSVHAGSEDFYKDIINKIREPVSPRVALTVSSYKAKQAPVKVRPEINVPASLRRQSDEKAKIVAEQIISFYKNEPVINEPVKKEIAIPEVPFRINPKKSLNFAGENTRKKHRAGLWFLVIFAVGIISYGLVLKNELRQDGVVAFANLQEAGENLMNLNFDKASVNFEKSFEDFAQISKTMNFMGAGIAGYFSDLPIIDKVTGGSLTQVKSAKDVAEAGKLIAQSGQAMSDALTSLAGTGSILNPADKDRTKPSKIISRIKQALLLSDKNFRQAKALILSVDESVIPEDKRAKLNDFKNKIPLFEEYLGNAIEYSDFLEGVVGIDKSRKYLLLFQNSSELRPTGGFPGTYGVVSFSGGGLSDFFVNDVYNLDGQLKRNVIPPKPLQHITPTWGMRDSAWFIDFPASARKAMSFFSEEAGYRVNGVITINPDIVSNILKIVGPIKMPEYDMTLTDENFLESIQEEVEYGDNRQQPKKVVADFAPRFLEKLYSADADKWMQIFNVFMAGLQEKDISFYFEDKASEDFAIAQGFGGEVKNPTGDYLMVNLSNVKGSKTDAVTDSSISVQTRFDGGRAIHKVIIERTHKGGDKEHGFYNKQNPAYVRVLVPEEAELLNISGNDIPNYKPLVNYSAVPGFEADPDLKKFESGFFKDSFPGVEKFYESGKKGIAFWMVVDPGKTKKIEFEYSVPASGKDYQFYFQKQPGLDWKNSNLTFVQSDDFKIESATPVLNRVDDRFTWYGDVKTDLDFRLNSSKE